MSAPDISVMSTPLTRLRRLSERVVRGDGHTLFALFHSLGTQVLITAINLVTGVITARMLGPEGRGAFAATTTWPQFFAMVSIAGLSSALVFRMRKSPETASSTAGTALLVASGASIAAIAAGIAVLPLLMSHYPAPIIVFAQLCLASVLVNSLQMIIKQAFAGIGEFGQYNLANLLPQLLYLVALLSMVSFGTLSMHGAVLALLGGGVAALLLTLPKFVRMVRPKLTGGVGEFRALTSYSTRASLTDLVYALSSFADRLVLIPFLPIEELGLYAVAFSFSRVVQLAQPAIMSVMFSNMSGRSRPEGKHLHDKACRFLVAALVGGCALLWLLGERLLVLTYGAEFGEANTLFRLLIVEAALGVLSQVTVQLFLSCDRPGLVSTIQVSVLAFSIGLLLLLVPTYGAQGAAAALVIAAAARWLVLLACIKFVLHLPLPRLYLVPDDIHAMLGRLRR